MLEVGEGDGEREREGDGGRGLGIQGEGRCEREGVGGAERGRGSFYVCVCNRLRRGREGAYREGLIKGVWKEREC